MTLVLLALEALAAPFAALGVVVSFAFSRRRGILRGLASELPERLGGLSSEGRTRLKGRRVWWLHAASAGEVAGLGPLIAALSARPGAPAVLVTTLTAAGRDAARRDPHVAWAQLAPLDGWPCVARFLRQVRLERLILSETELWPSLILLSARAGLRPTLINARLTKRSLPRYRAIAWLLRPVLGAFDAVLAQSELDAERFQALGVPAPKIIVAGNTKYDRAAGADSAASDALDALDWKDHPLFVAGSTHPVEEDMILDAFRRCAQSVPNLRLVLAPRHVERADEVSSALDSRGLRWIRWSRLRESPPAEARVLLLDTLGVLASLWPKAAAAFVGGTMVPVGGHNLLEPAQAGVPVLFGPFTEHIEFPALLLENGGGGLRVTDAPSLAHALDGLLQDSPGSRAIGAKARELSHSLRGATARILGILGYCG